MGKDNNDISTFKALAWLVAVIGVMVIIMVALFNPDATLYEQYMVWVNSCVVDMTVGEFVVIMFVISILTS